MNELPQHVAIIMDGNGRWAQRRSKNRYWGHVKGSEVAQNIVEHCARKTGITHLTLYAFSTENWSRPEEEVSFLFKLLDHHIKKKQNRMMESNIKLQVIGDLEALPSSLRSSIQSLVGKTKNNSGLVLTLALNYGGRQDLIKVINTYFENHTESLTEQKLDQLMQGQDLPHPDFIIRTSGEQRLSNFMLWQAAYSELYFCDTLWPDFSTNDFDVALNHYQNRERRFGCVPLNPTTSPDEVESTF